MAIGMLARQARAQTDMAAAEEMQKAKSYLPGLVSGGVHEARAAKRPSTACRFFMPCARNARGKVPGRSQTPPPFPLVRCFRTVLAVKDTLQKIFQNQERFSSAAHTPRALDCSGPSRKPNSDEGKGRIQSQNLYASRLPLVGPKAWNPFAKQNTKGGPATDPFAPVSRLILQ